MRFPRLLLLLGLMVAMQRAAAQQRIPDHNTVGWLVYEGNHKLSEKWQLHSELQWRRVRLVRDPQQLLARLGTIFQLTNRVSFGNGYTFFVTYPYGDYPTADQGRNQPEHRLYEDVQVKDQLGRLALTHRGRLEQRWLGQINEDKRVGSWEFQNRVRYQLNAQFPLVGPTLDSHEPYLVAFDEVFLSFGRNVGNNVFNQNRLAGGVGYQVSNNFRLELEYLYQIMQHPENAPATAQPVFEFNHGLRTVLAYDLDFTR